MRQKNPLANPSWHRFWLLQHNSLVHLNTNENTWPKTTKYFHKPFNHRGFSFRSDVWIWAWWCHLSVENVISKLKATLKGREWLEVEPEFYEGAYGVELIVNIENPVLVAWIISFRSHSNTSKYRAVIEYWMSSTKDLLLTMRRHERIRYQFDLTTIVKVEHMRPQTLTG